MIFFFLLASFVIIFNQPVLAADHTTLIMNQVRGAQCCSPGNVKNLELQIKTALQLNLASTFALRYDVLNNQTFATHSNYQNHSLIEWAAFLEITPQLAQDAGVTYSGNESNWYEAQFAYLIGYTQSDRQKIIKTYMEQFKKIFGDYPKSSTPG
jgi:hypothetical protein